jgi:CHAT domain-containing protein
MPPAGFFGTCVKRLLLPLLILLAVSAPADAKRLGLDLEVYDPPFARSDPAVAAILKAYDAERDDEVERLSRRLVEAREARAAAPLDRVEALFLLGRAVQDQQRPSEAESHYRAALALLKPLVGGKDRRAKTARQWAYYVEVHLRPALTAQGRLREARLLQSILPPAPAPRQEPERGGLVSSGTEQAVTSVAPIRTTPCPGAPAPLRALSQAEQDRREAWDSAAFGGFRKQHFDAAEKALRDKLAFDLAAYGEPHCEVAVDRAMLADALFRRHAEAEAVRLARQAVAAFDALPQPPPARLATIGLLADIVASQSGPRAAEPFLRRIYDARETQGNSREKLYARVDLAGNLYAQGRSSEAEALYRKALATAAAIGEERGDLALDIRVFLGFLAGNRGDDATAVAEYRTACTVRGEYAAQAGRGSRATLLATDEAKQAGSCTLRRALALRRWAESGGGSAAGDRPPALLAEAFEAAQTALPSPSADALARSSARIAAAHSGQGALAERFEDALRRRDAAGGPRRPSWNYWDTADTSPLAEEERERLDGEIADLATRLAAADPRFWDLRSPRPLGLAALQGLLRDDEALIFFMVPPKQLVGLVFAVSRNAAAWAPLGYSGDALREKVAALRGGIDARAYGVTPDGKPQREYLKPFDRRLAFDLYRALFGDAGIQAVLKPAHNWIVVPTGPLTSLPPGLLVTAPPSGDDDDPEALRTTAWLLRDKAAALLPSVASLRTLRQLQTAMHETAVEPLLAFADPDFAGAEGVADRGGDARRGYDYYYRNGEPDLSALKRLHRLGHTREEALALAAALDAPPADVLTGRDASRRELMARNADGRLARARVIEFATHGLVGGPGDAQAEPALVLASGATPRDWLLTASDAATLRINADWVLLSACNTASPDGGGAEGLSGLMRGFFHAGASALLVSHWSVQDEAASRLIPRTLLLQRDGKLGRAEALRRASLELLDTPGGDFAHPFFWAPFTLVGDPR